jgi:hypothetical protein
MATFKLLPGLGMTVALPGFTDARPGYLSHTGAFLNDASSSGATTAPTSEQ